MGAGSESDAWLSTSADEVISVEQSTEGQSISPESAHPPIVEVPQLRYSETVYGPPGHEPVVRTGIDSRGRPWARVFWLPRTVELRGG